VRKAIGHARQAFNNLVESPSASAITCDCERLARRAARQDGRIRKVGWSVAADVALHSGKLSCFACRTGVAVHLDSDGWNSKPGSSDVKASGPGKQINYSVTLAILFAVPTHAVMVAGISDIHRVSVTPRGQANLASRPLWKE